MSEKDGGPDLLGFAKAMHETWCELEGCDLDSGSLQEILEQYGLLEFRAPKPSEVADLEWWGHEFYDESRPDHSFVGVKPAPFIAMLKARTQGGENE